MNSVSNGCHLVFHQDVLSLSLPQWRKTHHLFFLFPSIYFVDPWGLSIRHCGSLSSYRSDVAEGDVLVTSYPCVSIVRCHLSFRCCGSLSSYRSDVAEGDVLVTSDFCVSAVALNPCTILDQCKLWRGIIRRIIPPHWRDFGPPKAWIILQVSEGTTSSHFQSPYIIPCLKSAY